MENGGFPVLKLGIFNNLERLFDLIPFALGVIPNRLSREKEMFLNVMWLGVEVDQ